MTVINPATEEVIATLLEDGKNSLLAKYQLLRASQMAWSQLKLEERLSLIKNFYDLMEKEAEELAAILTSEVGKPVEQSRNEINGARIRIQWMLNNAEKYLSDELMTETDGMQEKIAYEPLGI